MKRNNQQRGFAFGAETAAVPAFIEAIIAGQAQYIRAAQLKVGDVIDQRGTVTWIELAGGTLQRVRHTAGEGVTLYDETDNVPVYRPRAA